MYWKYKLPLIFILLSVLVLLCLQAAKAFHTRTEKEKNQQNTQEETVVSNDSDVQRPPETATPSADAPQPLAPPKPFTINEVSDSQGKNTPQPVPFDKPATPAAQPAPVAPPSTPVAQTTPQPAPVTQPATPVVQTTQQPATAPQPAKPAASTPIPAPPNAAVQASQTTGTFQAQFSQIQELLAKNEFVQARTIAYSILSAPSVKEYDEIWRNAAQIVSDVNRNFVTSPTPCPEKETYVVKSGDVLVRIAYRQKTTAQALMKMNRIKDPRRLWEGQKLAYIPGDWSIKVSKSQFLLTLYRSGTLYRIFKVGIGKDNRTPVGTFQIRDKVINPPWDSPEGRILPSDPRNILGTRWMGLEATGNTSPALMGYGIHGTTLPETVGTPSSAGCVRLKNEDVEDLFDLIPEPNAAKVPVTIIE